tara:strand:+ start:10309 stop:10866 length:558 start_codon:yes stop_codon:yes gene_type:complete
MGTEEIALKNKKIIIVVGFLIFVVASLFYFYRPSYTENNVTIKTELVDPFSSLMNPAQAQDILKNANYSVEVIEDSKLENGDTRPAFSILSWKIKNYEHLGIKGTLTITFFNQQMASTRFYPNDHLAYADLFSKKVGLELKEGTTSNVPPKTNLQYKKDLDGNFYFEWQDKDLQNQIDDWIKTYS